MINRLLQSWRLGFVMSPQQMVIQNPPMALKLEEPDSKRAQTEDAEFIELNYARTFDETEFGYVMNIVLEFDSHRKIKRFLRAPAAFLVQQMRDCGSLIYERLAPHFKVPVDRAKHKEVSSFIKSEAVRKCLDQKEEDEAWGSKRIMGCRLVLTWKGTPNEDLKGAAEDAANNPDTIVCTWRRPQSQSPHSCAGISTPRSTST